MQVPPDFDAGKRTADTPVVLILYNRPETTRRVFAAIRRARPGRLFLIADGARDRAGDADRVAAARAEVAEIDWPCAVERCYAEANLGCGLRTASGLDAAFAAVDAAIVLEDDCAPVPGFFGFCGELLDRYRDDPRIAMISGCNPLDEWRPDIASYLYTHYGTAWGWATWRRAWRLYDRTAAGWRSPEVAARLRAVLGSDDEVRLHLAGMVAVEAGKVDTWDVQWDHACLRSGALAIVPSRNMIENIGFGKGATHTHRRSLLDATRRVYEPGFPLRAPARVTPDLRFDRQMLEFRSGRPTAAGIVHWAEGMLARGNAPAALAAIKAGRRTFADDAALCDLEARVLLTLRPRPA